MKKYLILILSLFIAISTFAEEKTKTLPLDSMIIIINSSLDEANQKLASQELDIKTAKITLKTAYDIEGGVGLKLFVKASKKWELEKASTLVFEYEKPKRKAQKFDDRYPKKKFEEKLTKAILIAANQWQNSLKSINGLNKSKFSIEISFIMKDTSGGGLEFEIWGVGADLSGNYEKTAVHSVKLTFDN